MNQTRFSAQTERQIIASDGGSRRHVLVSLTAPSGKERQRPPINLALVLDRSGSMAGEKIRLAREAAITAVGRLKPTDRFAVVSFDEKIEVVVPSTPATPQAQALAVGRIRKIDARGSTDLCGGWLQGCEQVARGLSPESIGRVILTTDGLANHGITDFAQIVDRVMQQRQRRIVTSTVGIGLDFAEQLLGQMADAGGGHFYYVEKDRELPEAIGNEVGEVLEVVARDAELVVQSDAAVSVECLNPYLLTRSGTEWTIALGDLVQNQQLSLVLSLRFPPGTAGERCVVRLTARDRDGHLGVQPEAVQWRWDFQAESERQPRELVVDRAVARIYAARARREASAQNRKGDLARAEQGLRAVAGKIRTYAHGDPELVALVAELEREATEVSRPLDASSLKAHFFRGYAAQKGRDAKGHSLRRPEPSPAADRHRPRLLLIPASPGLRAALDEAITPTPASTPTSHLDLVVWPHGPASSAAGAAAGVLTVGTEAAVVASLASILNDDIKIVFTEMALPDGWFSHWHGTARAAVVSTAGWGQLCPLPLPAFLAYELLLHGFRALGPGYDPTRLLHEETRGCIFDLCRHRQDIEHKLRAAELCPACLPRLAQVGIPLEAFYLFCAHIRCLTREGVQAF